MNYKGPLVVANKMLIELAVAEEPVKCFFCCELFANILEHLKSSHTSETLQLCIKEGHKNGPVTLRQFRSYLVRRSIFKHHNFKAWWLSEGALMPSRQTRAIRDARSLVICSYCFNLIDEATWVAHSKVCIMLLGRWPKPDRRENR